MNALLDRAAPGGKCMETLVGHDDYVLAEILEDMYRLGKFI